MKNNKKVWIISICTIILTVILIVLSLSWSQRNVNNLTKWHNAKMSPVIMIPGSSASVNRFDRLVNQLNRHRKNPPQSFKSKGYEG